MMPIKSWKLAMTILIVLCVTFTLIEPGAFAASPPAQAPATKSTADTASPHKKSGRKKWIVILAVTAGAVVAAILVTQKKETSTPTITVGAPTVG